MTEMLPRLRGWELRLADAVSRQARMPFAWGTSDCLVLVADAAVALTSIDPMADWRGRYRTQLGARRLLGRLGHDDIGAALAAQFEETAPAMARRGDCGLIDIGGDLAAVVVMGADVVGKSVPVNAGGTGLALVSRDRMVRAFRIGE